MKAIIFAAGKGTRMMPLTAKKQKSMLPIAGKPILEHVLETLPSQVSEILLVVGHQKEGVQEYFGREFGSRKIHYCALKRLVGTADALLACKGYLRSKERFLLLYGDDLRSQEAVARLVQEDLAILGSSHERSQSFGVLVKDEEGNLIKIEEKPATAKSGLVSCGAYVFNADIFSYKFAKSEEFGEYLLTDIMNQMAQDQKFKVVETDFWYPIVYPEDLERAEKYIHHG